MGSLGFSDKFGNEDCGKDLSLSSGGDGGPLVDGLHGGERLEGDIRAQHTGKVDTGSLHDEASAGQHGDTSVLKFGSFEPVVSLLTTDVGQAQGVEVLNGHGASRLTIKGDSAESRAGLKSTKKTHSSGKTHNKKRRTTTSNRRKHTLL